MTMPGPKPMLSLQDWIPRTLEESRALYALLLEHGVTSKVARSVIGRLQTMPFEGPLSNTDRVERSQLRRMFANLGEPPWSAERAESGGELRPLRSVRGRRLNVPALQQGDRPRAGGAPPLSRAA